MNYQFTILTIYYLFISYLNGFLAINLVNKIKFNPTLPDTMYSLLPRISNVYPNILLIFFYGYFIYRFAKIKYSSFFFKLLKCLNVLFTMRIFTFSMTTYPPTLSKCYGRNPGDPIEWNIVKIILSNNDNTCIDYMFSGHTTYFVLFLLFIYEMSNSLLEKTLFTIYVIISIFSIIAGHIHYTSDVIVAIFITISCYSNL